MRKYFAIAVWLAVFNDAHAHSHPGIDSFTHSLEHVLLANTNWMPYLLGSGVGLALIALLRMRQSAKRQLGKNSRRPT